MSSVQRTDYQKDDRIYQPNFIVALNTAVS